MAHEQTPRHDAAHDVLAAEEFGVPAPDPALHRDEAHDVLAAEEFGVPAPRAHGDAPPRRGPRGRRALALIGAAAAVGALLWRKRRS
jgi:hypothetical protein